MKPILFLLLLLSFITFTSVQAKVPNPYKILGVSQSASEDQIKKAFKKRSLKYHPDRNTDDPKAKDKYAKVVNAYELLKDPQRKKMYDMTGDDNPQGAGGFQNGGFGFPGGGFPGGGFGINIEDLLRGMGGMGGGQRAQGQGRPGQGQRQGQGQQGGRQYTFSFGGGEGFRFQF